MLMSGYEAWSFKATHGLPLIVVLEELKDAGVFPKWDELLLAAKADGCKMTKLVDELKQAIVAVYDEELSRFLCRGIELLVERMTKDGRL